MKWIFLTKEPREINSDILLQMILKSFLLMSLVSAVTPLALLKPYGD